MDDVSGRVTQLLRRAGDGDAEAVAELFPLVYDELRRMARGYMRRERGDHTLQTTALVNEAYLKLTGSDVSAIDRAHFMRLAARAMRRILVDHARTKRAAKRGGGEAAVTLDEAVMTSATPAADIVALDAALDALRTHDDRKASVVELFYFGGLSYEEIARTLEISVATATRDMRVSRAWLHREMVESRGAADEG